MSVTVDSDCICLHIPCFFLSRIAISSNLAKLDQCPVSTNRVKWKNVFSCRSNRSICKLWTFGKGMGCNKSST